MYAFHKNKKQYFDWQYYIARDYIIPFVQNQLTLSQDTKVLEIGCGEAGVLKAFHELGMDCTGIELNVNRYKLAKENYAGQDKIQFIHRNIFDIDVEKDLTSKFDLIILKDVIEHIPGHEKFMQKLKDFLAPGGVVFFGFPPWQMPFGGHQQIAKSKLSKLPYLHLIPRALYKKVLDTAKEKPHTVEELMELTETGLSIGQFEKLCKKTSYEVLRKQHFLINPIYQYKFKLKPRKQLGVISKLPYLRNFITSCAYYLVRDKPTLSNK